MTETDLIERAREGNETAWETLVRRHQEAVFRLAYLVSGAADDAEDIAQEAFIRAYQHLDRFDASRPLRPWLLRIAKNLAYNRTRSVRRYLKALERFARNEPEPVTTLGVSESQHWEATLVWRAVRRLKRQDQEIIYLRYFLELPVADTAETLDIAEGTVKSRTYRALQRLQAVIETEFPSLAEART